MENVSVALEVPLSVHVFLLYLYTFYSCNNTDWIANTEIGLGPSNNVIKRLWCTSKVKEEKYMPF